MIVQPAEIVKIVIKPWLAYFSSTGRVMVKLEEALEPFFSLNLFPATTIKAPELTIASNQGDGVTKIAAAPTRVIIKNPEETQKISTIGIDFNQKTYEI